MHLLPLSLLTALAFMVCSLLRHPRPSEAAPTLADAANHWAAPYISTMVDKGILTGYPDGTFRPDGYISREEFAAVLARAKGITKHAGKQHFSDVGPDRWSFAIVGAVVDAGIIHPEDYGNTFDPTSPITRAEIATMLVRAGGFENEIAKKTSLVSFSDPIPDWARGYITVALNHGLVTSYDDGTFRPGGKATRAEAGLR